MIVYSSCLCIVVVVVVRWIIVRVLENRARQSSRWTTLLLLLRNCTKPFYMTSNYNISMNTKHCRCATTDYPRFFVISRQYITAPSVIFRFGVFCRVIRMFLYSDKLPLYGLLSQVTAEDTVFAEKLFGNLAYVTTSQLPQSRLLTLLGDSR